MIRRGSGRGAVVILVATAALLAACGEDDNGSVNSNVDVGKDVENVESWPATEVDLGSGEPISFRADEKPRFVFFNFGSGYAYTAAITKGAQDRAKALGVELDVLDARVDPQKQVQQIQDAITSGKYAGGFVLPIAEALLCDLGTKVAPANNFMFVTTNAPLCDRVEKEGEATWAPGSLAFVSAGQEISKFQAWAARIQQDNPGPQKVIALVGPEQSGQSRNAVAALEQVEADNPDFEIVEAVYTNFSTADALAKMQDAMQTNGDATIVASIYSELTKPTVTVLKQLGLEDQVAVYDVGADSTVLPLIESGDVEMTYPYYPQTMGATAIQALVDARLGKTPITRFYDLSGHPTPDLQGDETLLFVTSDNVAEFEAANLSEY